MPVYQIKGKNGKVYQIKGPANATREQIVKAVLQQAPEAGVAPQEESFIESIPLVGGILGNIADYPAKAVEGLAGVTESIAASTGAGTGLTEFFGDIAEGARGFRTKESREAEQARAIRSQLAEERGVGAELGAAVQNFLEAPLESTAELAGSALPFIGAGLASPFTGGASLAPVAALGVAAGLGGAKSDIYDSVYEAAKESGASDEQASALAERAQEYGGKNLDQISLAGALGGLASATGFAPAIARTIGSRASARVAQRIAQREAAEAAGEEVTRRSLAGGFARGVTAEALPEGIQAGQQRYAANLALQREGFDVDPWQGVAGAAAAEGLASILLGGYGGVRETNLDNIRATTKQFEKKVEDLPDNPTEEDEGELAQWAMRRGFSAEEARIIGRNAADQKRRVAQAKAETEAALREARETRLADVEPSAEPDITAPGMVREEQEFAAPSEDPEVVAERVRAYEAQMGGAAQPDAPTPFLTPEEQQIRAARSRAYNQRQRTASSVESDLAIYGKMVAAGQLPPTPLINKLATRLLDLQGTPSMDTLAASEVGPVLQQFFANEAATFNEVAAQKQAAQAQPAAPSRRGPPQPMDLTPERAGTILSDPIALSDYEASGGDVEALYEIAEGAYEGPSIKYSRGRRPVDTATPDMFAGAPLQEAPGVEAKREELAAQRFATDEERLARQEQFAAEMEAGQERVLAMRQREEEQREETLGDIEYALRAQAPENAVYKVVYDPTSNSAPYKLVAETQLGKKPEEVLSAQTLQDFSDQVYGRMMELTPYIPEAPAAIQEIEERESGEQAAPTAATRMIQEFTAEVDAAREAGQIDNLQRSELLGRLRRPNAYRTLPNGRQVPNDAIAKREKEAIDAASAAANAPADQKEALAAASKEANDKLRAAVKNSLLNPARAALKSMVEMRQDEKVGAKVRIKEAERAERAATRDMRKAMESGKGVLEADVTPEREQIQEAQKEKREAKIDLAQQRVQKYRKGGDKEPGGPPKVVSVTDVQAMVDKITAQWKSTNPVVVVASVDDIPDAKLRRAIKRDKALGANGLIAPDGTIYLIADNLLSMEDAKSVLFHEALGHLGLEKLFRNNLDNALVTMYRGNAKLRADTDKWRSENRGAYENDANPLARAVEEVLAERSERGQIDRSLFQKLAAIVRNFARRMGINLKISDGDVAAILSMAHDKVVSGDIESAIVKGLRYVTAWHGSRADFDRFDTGFMGTGEGAQAYGWGLYFTDTKEIAEKTYRDRLAGAQYMVGGQTLQEWADDNFKSLGVPYAQAVRTIERQLSRFDSPQELLDVTRDLIASESEYLAGIEAEASRDRGPEDEEDAPNVAVAKRLIARLDREVVVLERLIGADVKKVSAGKLYSVELAPKDDEWLLWDKPFYDQSFLVQDALRRAGFGADRVSDRAEQMRQLQEEGLRLYNEYASYTFDAPPDFEYTDAVVKRIKAIQRAERALKKKEAALRFDAGSPTATGNTIYGQFEAALGSPKAASLALLDAGIRGNKYLDGFSRGARGEDNPTFNYVLFSDEDVEITAKYSRKKAETTPKDAKKVEEASERLSDGARKVQKSLSTEGMTNGLEEMVKGRSFKDWGGAIWSNWNLFSPGKQQKILKVVPTSGILGWVKPEFKALHDKMAEVDERVQKMAALKNRILNASEDLAREIQDFADAHGTTDLFVTQAMARINEVAPDEFASALEALQKNAVIVEIERKMLKNSNNKAETRKLIDEIKQLVMDNKDSVELKGDKFRMSGALTNKLRALERLSKDSKPISDKVEQLAEMTRRIRDTYKAWDKLGQQENGHKIYKEMRSFYKDMFEAELALLDERINLIADKEEAIRIKDMRAKLMREVVSPDERKKQGDLFYDIDADLFQKDYVPFMREGDHYLIVTADKRGTREREFHTFRTERELQAAQKEIAKRLGVDPEDSSVIVIGYDIGELQKYLRTEDELMGRVFNIVGEARAKYEAEDKIDLKELTDSIYQTWLMTTPERSVRRRLMHAEEVVGFSPDTFLHFRTQASTYANQLSKLAYAGQIRQGIEEAREVINDPERPTTERAKWNIFVRELESRTEDEINPQEQNRWVNGLNRLAYFYYLTSARTALIQLATIPIRVVPRMWRDYGYVKGTAQWLKYLKMWKSLGRVKVEREKTRFGDRLDAFMPTVSGSEFVSKSADLQWAKRMGAERGILDTLQDTLVQNERATPGKTTTGLRRATEDTLSNTAQFMGFLFKGMDNLSRQASYYMTFELAVEKYRSENKPTKGETDKAFDERARQYALKKAVDMVRHTVGDFSTWERPGLAKGNVARSAFLFKMHALVQTQFMTGAMRDMARGTAAALGKGPAEAKAEGIGALKELSGVLLMAGMFGGLMGMPLYSVMIYALMGAFGPDEEDDEDVRALMGGDPRTAYDPDIAFRSWMNDKFGDIKIGDASLADILTEGPISTALGVELASSTSLDIMNMWFRDPVVGDSTEDTILQTIAANVAPLSMLGQISRGYDSFAEGNIRDGLRKMLPAFFRTGANAYYNETEGVKNRRGDTLIPKEEITAADNFKDVLGFRAPKLNRIQQYAITRTKNETAIKSERKGILDRFERAYTEGEIQSRADLDAFIKEEIIPFNRTYPAPEFLITEETLADSLERRAGIRARTIEGVQFDKKTLPQDLAAQRRFVQ